MKSKIKQKSYTFEFDNWFDITIEAANKEQAKERLKRYYKYQYTNDTNS